MSAANNEIEEKPRQYELLIKQMRCMMESENDAIALMANASSLLSEVFPWHWIGFYRVIDNQLVLGPFQGPVACTRIAYNKGVCGTTWARKETIVVPDVEQFPGHIACSSLSSSEIVVPIFDKNNEVKFILDIDSTELDAFDDTDRHYLEAFCALFSDDSPA